MEELIFFAVIIFFSIIESIARSRKRKAGGPLPDAPPEWEQGRRPSPRPEPRPGMRGSHRPDEVPSYDADPSFDAEGSFDAEPSFDESKSRDALEKERATSSESMIPADIWDEIAGLAREPERQEPTYTPPPRPQQRRTPAPSPKRVPVPQRPIPKAEPRRAPLPSQAPKAPKPTTAPPPEPAPEGVAAHVVHESHVGYGTDPSARPPSAHDRMDPLARALGADASAARAQLRNQGAHALRQALILHEVLGPPAAEREDRF